MTAKIGLQLASQSKILGRRVTAPLPPKQPQFFITWDMSVHSRRQSRRKPVELILPEAALDADDDYGDLSVIQFTPRNISDRNLRTLTSILPQTTSNNAHSGWHLDRHNSDASSSLSFPRSPRVTRLGEKRSESSLSGTSFLSMLTGVWGKTGSAREEKYPSIAGSHSPLSVVHRRESSTMSMRSYEEEKQALKWPIFASADCTDAREFQEFLDDEGGSATRLPVLCLVDYGGAGAYAVDIWVLMNNSIRRELFDTYEILKVIRQHFLSVTVSDIYELRKWWRFYTILWSEYEMYQASVLDPLIRQICLVDGRRDVLASKLRSLQETREWLGLKMEEISSYIEEFERLPPARALCLFCKTVDSYAHRTMTYFNAQEQLLPPLVENYHGSGIKLEAECALLEQMRKNKCFPELLVALMRWMGTVQGYSSLRAQAKERDKWLGTHLYWRERQQLTKYFRRYEVSHGKVLEHFLGKGI